MTEIDAETIRRNELSDGYIRLVISRGEGDLGLNPDSCTKANVVVIVEELKFRKFVIEDGERYITRTKLAKWRRYCCEVI